MSLAEPAARPLSRPSGRSPSGAATAAVFTLAIFLSATLLFLVQPMFSKMVLPRLGGSPAVWTTCMLFFQLVLLAGYAYAHFAPTWLGERRQAVVHLSLFAGSLLLLPIGIPSEWAPPASSYPVASLVVLLTLSLGAPFFLLSTTGPLLQRWFSRTGHSAARDPYFLYAASNLGSMIALLAYPVVVEPLLRLREQSWLWSAGYVAFGAALTACALLVFRGLRRTGADDGESAASEAIGGRRRARWVLLAFAPSSLLLGVTSHITTDIAAVPLLWVVPLALYLLTFTIVFSRRPVLSHAAMVRLQPVLIIPAVLIWFWTPAKSALFFLPLHLAVFFVAAIVCHGRLAADRPSARHLTEFYLMVAAGGALGGIFNVLIAPHVFDSIAEYPLMLALTLALRPGRPPSRREEAKSAATVMAIIALMGGAAWSAGRIEASGALPPLALNAVVVIATSVTAALWYGLRAAPVWFALAFAGLLVARGRTADQGRRELFAERSFFGVHRVYLSAAGRHHLLAHGTTIHGAQSLDPEDRTEPLTYFGRQGPLGDVFRSVRSGDRALRVGVLGLGTGSIAAYSRPGDEWVFYEIDPTVERIARDDRYFTYLRDAEAPARVVLGDGRLTIEDAADGAYDLLILDAFTSDAVPVHLITREALALYLTKLAPGGVIAFNLSNRYLDLVPVVGALFGEAGLHGKVRLDRNQSPEHMSRMLFPSYWAVAARRSSDLRPLQDQEWRATSAAAGAEVWSDDFSDLLGAMRWR